MKMTEHCKEDENICTKPNIIHYDPSEKVPLDKKLCWVDFAQTVDLNCVLSGNQTK